MNKIVLVCIMLLLCFTSLDALITQWNGDTSRDWTTASNWSDGVPDATHSVIIPSSVASGNWPDLSSGSSTCYQVANYGTLDITGGTLNANYGFIAGSGSTTNLSGYGAINYGLTSGDFDCDGTVDVTDNALISGGDFNANTGSTLDLNGGWFSIDGDFNADGTVNVDGGAVYATNFIVRGTVTQTGGEVNVTQNMNNEGTYNHNGGELTANATLINTGTYNSAYGCTLTTPSLFNDETGEVDLGGGDQTITTLTNDGTFSKSGGTTNVNGDFINNGTCAQTGGGLNVDNKLTNSGSYNSAYGCSISVQILENGELGVFGNNGAPISIGTATNDGDFENQSGTTEILGDFTNSYSGETTVSGGTLRVGAADFRGNFIQSGGTVTVDNDLTFGDTSSNMQSGGTFNAKGDVEFNQSFINTGSTGEFVFCGGTSQSVTNPPLMPYTNLVSTLKVNNNSSVSFDERTSFASNTVEINGGTLDVGSGFLEPLNPGGGTLDVGSNSEIILGGSNTLPDFGTTILDPTSKVTYNSTTHNQGISSVNYGRLEVSGTNKTLDGNASVTQEMILNTIFDVGNYNLTLLNGATLTTGTNKFFATTGSGYLIRNNISSGDFPIGPDVSNYNGFSFDNNGTALTSIGARVETGIIPTHPNAMYCLQRTWDIIKEGILNADFTFSWLQTQETQPFEQARVNSRIVGHVCHTPPSWQVISTPSGATGSGMIGDPYEVEIHDIAIVSGFCLGDVDHTLPVTLSSLNALYTNDSGLEYVQVNWFTATETDVLGFNIYQSSVEEIDDATKINTSLIYGHGTSSTEHSYSYDDLDADLNIRNYYWIEQIDFNGLSEFYGPAVYIPGNGGEPGSVNFDETKILQQYPNPVANNMKIEYQIKGSADQQDVEIDIYNIKGEYVETVPGQNGSVNVDLSGYATGVYFYRLQNTSLGDIYKFVVIK